MKLLVLVAFISETLKSAKTHSSGFRGLGFSYKPTFNLSPKSRNLEYLAVKSLSIQITIRGQPNETEDSTLANPSIQAFFLSLGTDICLWEAWNLGSSSRFLCWARS